MWEDWKDKRAPLIHNVSEVDTYIKATKFREETLENQVEPQQTKGISC